MKKEKQKHKLSIFVFCILKETENENDFHILVHFEKTRTTHHKKNSH